MNFSSYITEILGLAETSKSNYKDLAPIDDIPDDNTYLEALDWAINNNRIKNIALSGPYGAGKSSIIRSYLKNHSKLKYVNVSLGSFLARKPQDEENAIPNTDEIQQAILQQLFYKVKYETIPQSRYRKLHKIDSRVQTLILATIIIAAFVYIPNLLIFFISPIDNAVMYWHLPCETTYWVISLIIILISILAVNIYRNHFGKIDIKEVKLPVNTTLVTNQDNEQSVFNRNLDEIVYLFEEINYHVVFFEDLDRLNKPEIFVALRELSTILNNAESITHPIKFVYAVRDDIFTAKDRTKFFDFIIPIIPIINSTNSGETLTRLINETKETITIDISNEYIMDISPYISDMRLLQNICNEFLIYKKTLQSAQSLNLKDEKMFSLIIFKNLYPKEFADLQDEKGIIKQVFEEKRKYVTQICVGLQSKIRDLTKELGNIHNEAIKTKRELIVSLLCAISNWRGFPTRIEFDSRCLQPHDFLKTEFDFKNFRNSLTNIESINVFFNTFSNANNRDTYRCPTNDPLFEQYSQRFEYVSVIENQKIEDLRKELENKQEEILTIREYTLKRLIEEFEIDVITSDEIKSNKLLIYMLRMGYIDESYTNYINYFKGTSITTADMNFILAIKNHEPLPPNYDLSQIEQIINRLQPQEFEQEEIFNFKLLEFLLNSNKYKEELKRFICKLSKGTEKSWLFFDEFVNKSQQTNSLFHEISNKWSDFWSQIVQNNIFTQEKKNYYLTMILTYAEIEDIKVQNKNSEISNYILESSLILKELSNVPTAKFKSVIDELNLVFYNVDLHYNSEIVSYIINEERYEICPIMIQHIMELLAQKTLPEINNQNYTTLLAINNKNVMEYIHKDWLKYVDEVILSQGNTEETTETVVEILRKTIDNIEKCVKVINHQNFKLVKLEDCTFPNEIKDKNSLKQIWNQLLINNKLEPLWQNVLLYWQNFELTEELLNFLEKNANSFSIPKPDEIDEVFIKQYLISNGDDETYRLLTTKLKPKVFDIPIANISESRLKTLIENKSFTLSLDIYNQIQSKYPNLILQVILNNQQEFVKLQNDIKLNNTTFYDLIISEESTIELKECLLKKLDKTKMTEDLAIELSKNSYNIHNEVFFAAWDKLGDENKKALLYNHLSFLKANDLERCFAELDEFKGFRERTKHVVKLANNKNNQNLAKKLKEVGYITSWKPENMEDKSISNEETPQVLICIVKQLNTKN